MCAFGTIFCAIGGGYKRTQSQDLVATAPLQRQIKILIRAFVTLGYGGLRQLTQRLCTQEVASLLGWGRNDAVV